MLLFHITESGFTFAIDERHLSCPFVFSGGGEMMEKLNSPRAHRGTGVQDPALTTGAGHGDSCPPPAACVPPAPQL